MRESHYQNKSLNYGAGHTRTRRIFELLGSIKGKRVLDVGCATGYMGAKIKEMGNYVAGVEMSEAAAKIAGGVLDNIYIVDIEREWPKELTEQKFDVILLAETLEHVFDPVEVLKKVNSVLSPGGFIVITTPNFMIWTNRFKFLLGRFKYEDQGMFDFGHIRFFTYSYLKNVLSESGFKLESERHIIFPGKLTAFLKFFPGIFAFQFIVKAKKL